MLDATSLDADWSIFDNVRQVQLRLFVNSTESLEAAISVDAYPAGGEDKQQMLLSDGNSIFVATRVWHLRASQITSGPVTQGSQITDTDGTVYLVGADIRYQSFRTRVRCMCTILNG
jgi:hypothetical protein